MDTPNSWAYPTHEHAWLKPDSLTPSRRAPNSWTHPTAGHPRLVDTPGSKSTYTQKAQEISMWWSPFTTTILRWSSGRIYIFTSVKNPWNLDIDENKCFLQLFLPVREAGNIVEHPGCRFSYLLHHPTSQPCCPTTHGWGGGGGFEPAIWGGGGVPYKTNNQRQTNSSLATRLHFSSPRPSS